jgi:isoaspartyl peptidase/L-asparaginase-like protein (Ntn-hydrolase superfamily)
MQAMLAELGQAFDADIGFIAVDRHGSTCAQHRTRDMPHAYFEGQGEVVARMRSVVEERAGRI